jgi:hypothetical protein
MRPKVQMRNDIVDGPLLKNKNTMVHMMHKETIITLLFNAALSSRDIMTMRTFTWMFNRVHL